MIYIVKTIFQLNIQKGNHAKTYTNNINENTKVKSFNCSENIHYKRNSKANIFLLIDLRDFFQNFGARGGNKNKIKIPKMDQSIEK